MRLDPRAHHGGVGRGLSRQPRQRREQSLDLLDDNVEVVKVSRGVRPGDGLSKHPFELCTHDDILTPSSCVLLGEVKYMPQTTPVDDGIIDLSFDMYHLWV